MNLCLENLRYGGRRRATRLLARSEARAVLVFSETAPARLYGGALLHSITRTTLHALVAVPQKHIPVRVA